MTDHEQIMSIVEREWPRCAPYLQEAIDHGGNLHTLESVHARVLDGRAQFFPMPHGGGVTEFVDYPTGRVLNFWLAGGDMDEICTTHDRLLPWARQNGAVATMIQGRRGWRRVFDRYEPVGEILLRRLP